jgi:hypothetical protein
VFVADNMWRPLASMRVLSIENQLPHLLAFVGRTPAIEKGDSDGMLNATVRNSQCFSLSLVSVAIRIYVHGF